MAKIRFYCDVPAYFNPDWSLCALTKPVGMPVGEMKRVAFDVDFPPEVLKQFDIPAIAGKASVVPVEGDQAVART